MMYPDKNQARRGGLEKYPRSKFCDHNQYCASSPYNEKFVKKDAQILRVIITKNEKAKTLFINKPFINKKRTKYYTRYNNL